MTALLRRLWSPAGFVLVGLCFLLPFIAVSCDATQDGKRYRFSSSYTGQDLVLGGRPDVVWSHDEPDGTVGTTTLDNADRFPTGSQTLSMPVDPYAVAALGLIAAAVLAAVLPWRRIRAALFALLGLGAVVTLWIAHLRATDVIVQSLQPLMADSQGAFDAEKARDAVGARYGFWLAIGLLGVLVAANVDAFVRAAFKAPRSARESVTTQLPV